MELTGRTALVTGATGGLGHAVARALHARGASLLLSGRRMDVLEPLAAELGGEAVAADLSDRADVARLAERAADVDVLVANAGLSASGPIGRFEAEEIWRVLDVNLGATVLLTRAAVEGMAARGAGHVLFMASVSGMTGQPGGSLYSATKFGLRGYAQALRAELRPRGVGVSAVFPGFIRDAGMFHDAGAKVPWYLGTSSPEAVADAVVKAIERNIGELVVAPPLTRVMTRFAVAAPRTAALLARRVGGDEITAKIIDGLAAGARRD